MTLQNTAVTGKTDPVDHLLGDGRLPIKSPRWRSDSALHQIIMIIDICSILVSATVACVIYYHAFRIPLTGGWSGYVLPSLVGSGVFVITMTYFNGYLRNSLRLIRWQLRHIVIVWFLMLFVLISAAFVGHLFTTYSRMWIFSWSVSALTLLSANRAGWALVLKRSSESVFVRNVIVVGSNDVVDSVAAKLQGYADRGIKVCGAFAVNLFEGSSDACASTAVENALRLARQIDIDHVILAIPLRFVDTIKDLTDKFKELPGNLLISVDQISETFPIRRLCHVAGLPMIEIFERPIKHWGAAFKWLEDKILASVILTLSFPLLILTALCIKMDSPGPVFFRQQRHGFNNKTISVMKFRTMYTDGEDRSGAQRTIPGDPRVTRVGRILRVASLDELPQLINVLLGEMSLVGPRPHAISMKVGERLYSDAVVEYAQRHRVKPGITGWAQINGLRGEIDSMEKARARVAYDLAYIERWSVAFDLKILALTFPAIFSLRNAY